MDLKDLDFKEGAVDAIAMLEQIEGEDAQAIIRDYKTLMKSFGIHFEKKGITKLKQKLFSKVVEGVTSESQILPEGDDSVIRANIPPAQYGFTEGKNVMMPTNGYIIYRSDDAVCIRIAQGEKLADYTILIEGFDVDASIVVNEQNGLTEGTVLGKTKKKDIKLTLRDENGAIVKNKYTAGPQEYQAQPDDEYRLATIIHNEMGGGLGCSHCQTNAKVRDEEGDWVSAMDRDESGLGGGLDDIGRTCAYVCINNALLQDKTIEDLINDNPNMYGSMSSKYNTANATKTDRYCEKCLELARWCLKYDCSSVVSSEGIPMTRNCNTESGFDVTNPSAWSQPNSLVRWWLIDVHGDEVFTDADIQGPSPWDCFFLRDTSLEEYEAEAEDVVEYDEDTIKAY